MIWFGFQGLSRSNSIILNVASIAHDPEEVDKRKFDEIKFEWGINQ